MLSRQWWLPHRMTGPCWLSAELLWAAMCATDSESGSFMHSAVRYLTFPPVAWKQVFDARSLREKLASWPSVEASPTLGRWIAG